MTDYSKLLDILLNKAIYAGNPYGMSADIVALREALTDEGLIAPDDDEGEEEDEEENEEAEEAESPAARVA